MFTVKYEAQRTSRGRNAMPLSASVVVAMAGIVSTQSFAQENGFLNDAMQPVTAFEAAAPQHSSRQAETEEATAALLESRRSLAERLASLTAAERANAHIEFEPMRSASAADRATSANAADLWNAGDFNAALTALASLEGASSTALSISWIEPPVAEGGIAGFGDTTISLDDATGSIALDVHKATGNLYCAVQVLDGWELYRSANGGLTWTNPYSWGGIPVEDLDMAIVGNLVYIGYVATGDLVGDLSDLRVRRSLTSTGASDAAYGFVIALDASPATIEEIAATSNAEGSNTNVFFAALQSDDTVGYHWDLGTDGTTWTEIDTAFDNGESGLDVTMDDSGTLLAISYIGSDGDVHVAVRNGGAWDDNIVETVFDGAMNRTAVSAWDDTIIVGYRDNGIDGYGLRYRITYDIGDTWNFGDLYVPGPADNDAFMFDFCARGGFGTSAIFTREAGAVDEVMFAKRDGYAPGGWDAWVQVNDVDFLTSTTREPDLNWVSTIDGSSNNHRFGIVYPQPDPMFDRRQHCDGDVNESGAVNVDDLIEVILGWGVCASCPPSCNADITPFGGDCNVDVDDMIEVILSWGPCP